jgi:hypothetical protein
MLMNDSDRRRGLSAVTLTPSTHTWSDVGIMNMHVVGAAETGGSDLWAYVEKQQLRVD